MCIALSAIARYALDVASYPFRPRQVPSRRSQEIKGSYQTAGVERMLTRRHREDDVLRGLDVDSDGSQTTSIVRNCRFRGPQLR